MIPFISETLSNGLTIEFLDRSNRYFGDYWRVNLEARCRVPIEATFPAGSSEAAQARALLGDDPFFSRTLEKMGVAGQEVEATRHSLVESFLASAAPYIGSPEFPSRFVRQKLAERRKGRRPFLVPR